MLGPTNLYFDQIGELASSTYIDVDESAVKSHTITAGKKVVILQVVDGSDCWFGGSTVDPTNYIGTIMTPRMLLIFRNAKSTFKVYFKCAAGKTAKIGINEAD